MPASSRAGSATAWWGAVVGLALLTLFTAAIRRSLLVGAAPECRCFGRLHSAPVGRGTLARDLMLAVIAGVVVAHGPGVAGGSATPGSDA